MSYFFSYSSDSTHMLPWRLFFFLGSPQFTDSFTGSLVLAKAARGRCLPACCYTRIDSYSRVPPESIYNTELSLQEVNGTLVNHDLVPKCYIKASAARLGDPALTRLHQRDRHTGTHGSNYNYLKLQFQ